MGSFSKTVSGQDISDFLAFKVRDEGLTYRDVGQLLGTSHVMVSHYIHRPSRRSQEVMVQRFLQAFKLKEKRFLEIVETLRSGDIRPDHTEFIVPRLKLYIEFQNKVVGVNWETLGEKRGVSKVAAIRMIGPDINISYVLSEKIMKAFNLMPKELNYLNEMQTPEMLDATRKKFRKRNPFLNKI